MMRMCLLRPQRPVLRSDASAHAVGAAAPIDFASVFLLVLVAFALLLVQSTLVLAEPSFPKLTGRVVDEAGLLSLEDKTHIRQQLKALEDQSTDQLVVVTLPSLQGYAIEDFGVRLGRHWAIGQKDKNNGVLLIIAPKERKVRIEVGYGLEGVLTDTLSGNIVHNRILPLFRKGRMAEGIRTGVDDIVSTLTGDAAAVAERAKGKKRSRGGKSFDPFGIIILVIWFFMFFGMFAKSIFGSNSGRGGVVIVPHKESSGQWRGGGGSFGGGSGGFSGGGGSFGGGGSSGGW